MPYLTLFGIFRYTFEWLAATIAAADRVGI